MKIWLGATGNVVKGNVMDVSRKSLEAKLRDYDSQLYVSWNSKKRQGYGCWELRRRPEKKTAIHAGTWNGMSFLKLEYKENGFTSHIMDLPCLSYEVITKLKAIDTWKDKDWVSNYERRADEWKRTYEEKQMSEMRYMIRQHKREINEFRELLLSGFNPARIAQYWNKAGS